MMEIKGYTNGRDIVLSSNSSMVLKQGDIYEAVVKEKVNDKEAIVQLRGMEVRVRVDQNIPSEGQITFEIKGQHDGVIEGKLVTKPKIEQLSQTNQLPKLETAELRQAVTILSAKQIPLTNETIEVLRMFFNEETGTSEQKLETIQAAASKRITINLPELKAIHEALHGKSIGAALHEIAKQLDPNFTFTTKQERTPDTLPELRAQLQTESNIDRMIDKLQQYATKTKDQTLTLTVREAIALKEKGQEQFARDHIIQAVISLEHASKQVKAENANESLNPKEQVQSIFRQVENALSVRSVQEVVRAVARELPVEMGKKVIRTLEQALRLEMLGLAQVARRQLIQSLLSVKENLAGSVHISEITTETVPKLQPSQSSRTETLMKVVQSVTSVDAAESMTEQSERSKLSTINEWEEVSVVRDLIQRATKVIQREADITKALDFVKTEVVPKIQNDGQKHLIMQAVDEAEKLFEKGREMAARQTVLNELVKIEAALPKEQPTIDGEWTMNMQLDAKDIIVQTITKRMAEAALEFKQTKRDMMRNLNAIDHIIQQYRQSAYPQAKQLLESTIKMLDQTILKSDVMLFADMMTEKRLLQASTQLSEAKKLLDKGNYEQARKIVQEVKNMLAQLQFKPSDVKVKHFVSQESIKLHNPAQAFWNEWNKTIQPKSSARHVLETIRRLGLTYESDVANALVFKEGKQEEMEQTAKGWLMKLAQTEGNPVAKQAEQAAMNITGQQLLNKWDGTSAMQTLFFTIPMLLHKEIKDVKIYVNARNDGKRIDWENCSLYFLLETRKLGDVGILLSANERNLSITFRNDHQDFSEKVSPFLETVKQNMEEIGYHIQSIQFTTLNEAKEEKQATKAKRATFTEEGYDFII
jgi:hypothetical protein